MAENKKRKKLMPIEVTEFTEACNMERLSKNLRKILLDYIGQNKDWLPVDFDLQLNDLNLLFDLLDALNK